MAIEFTQIHNVVRAYQRAIDILSSARQGAEWRSMCRIMNYRSNQPS